MCVMLPQGSYKYSINVQNIRSYLTVCHICHKYFSALILATTGEKEEDKVKKKEI